MRDMPKFQRTREAKEERRITLLSALYDPMGNYHLDQKNCFPSNLPYKAIIFSEEEIKQLPIEKIDKKQLIPMIQQKEIIFEFSENGYSVVLPKQKQVLCNEIASSDQHKEYYYMNDSSKKALYVYTFIKVNDMPNQQAKYYLSNVDLKTDSSFYEQDFLCQKQKEEIANSMHLILKF